MEKCDNNWDIGTTMKLIKKVEQQRILWDTHDVDFLNIVKKRRIFSEIGTEFGCIGSEIERKWRELRNQYRREKLQYSSLNALPTWFAYEHMRFVDNHDSCNSLTIAPTSPISANSSIAEASNAYFRAYKIHNGKFPLPNDTISDVEQSQTADRDEFEIFGEGVAAKLRKIQDPRIQLCVQRDIDNALYNALMKNVVPKLNPISAITSSSCCSGIKYSPNNFVECCRVDSPWPDKNPGPFRLRRTDCRGSGTSSSNNNRFKSCKYIVPDMSSFFNYYH